MGESSSPFIDEGDGLTNERERVRMLLNLVAHAGRFRMMVGAHNTIGCQMHVRGCIVLFEYGKCRYLPYCSRLEACGGLTIWELMVSTIL